MQWYREFLPAQPDELNGFFAFIDRPARARRSLKRFT